LFDFQFNSRIIAHRFARVRELAVPGSVNRPVWIIDAEIITRFFPTDRR